jgi:hypothetical protein
VEKDCRVKGSILGENCHLEQGCILEEGCVLGQGCHLEKGCYLSKNTVLDSHTKVLAGTRFSSRPFGLTPFFEESDLLFDRMLSEDFYIRLGYALARGAGGRIGIMRDEDKGSEKICIELLKGTFLAGEGATTLGVGFYTKATAAAFYGGFPLTVLVCGEKTGGWRAVLFDSAGLPANGRLVRKIRDAFLAPVVCGRVGRALSREDWAGALYRGLLLENVPSLVGLTVGMEKGTPAADFTATVLEEAGARVVAPEKGRLILYVTPDGRRCSLTDAQGQTADFWHLAAIVLSDGLRRGAKIRALPERAPEALFSLVSQNRSRPLSFALCAAAPCARPVRETLLENRFLVDGCLLALRCLSIIAREGLPLTHLLSLLPSFATGETGIDCGEGEKMELLLSLGGRPCPEGVCLVTEKGRLHARARGRRGLWLMAEAATDQDAGDLLKKAKETLAAKKAHQNELQKNQPEKKKGE